MQTEMCGYLGGTYKGSFQGENGKIDYQKVLILPIENSTEFVNASCDNTCNLEKLERFSPYTFKCELKGDKLKVVDVYAMA